MKVTCDFEIEIHSGSFRDKLFEILQDYNMRVNSDKIILLIHFWDDIWFIEIKKI